MPRPIIPRLTELRPAALKDQPFCWWHSVQQRDKDGLLIDEWDKVPCDERGYNVSAHIVQNWLSWDQVFAGQSDVRGVGVIIRWPFFGIDLDKCIDEHGNWSPLALEVRRRFPNAAYEVSLSGRGLHFFGRYEGEPFPHKKRVNTVHGSIELYTDRRFIVLTGREAWGDAGDCTAALQQFVTDYQMHLPPTQGQIVVGSDLMRGDSTAGQYTDQELGEWLRRQPGSAAVAFGHAAHPFALAMGDESWIGPMDPERPMRRMYESRSERDAAVMCALAFLTGCHGARMADLFRALPIYRPEKYEGTGDYRLRAIIEHGVNHTRNVLNVANPKRLLLAAPSGEPYVPPLSAGSWGSQTALPPPPLPSAMDGASLVAELAAMREWTILNWIPHRQVTLFGGDGGTGKTTLMLQLAVACAAGRPWMGMLPMRRTVLFVSGEDERDELKYRLQQVCKAMGHDGSGIHILTLESQDHPEMTTLVQGGRIEGTAMFDHIEAEVRRIGATFVMLDPVADLFGGDEMKRTHVRTFIAMIRRRIAIGCNATVLLSAHPSVDAMRSGRGYSGSTAWNNSVRSRFSITMGENDTREIELAKANRAKAGESFSVRWENGIFVRTDEKLSKQYTNDDVDELFIRILDRLTKTGQSVSPKQFATTFAQHEMGRGFTRSQFKSAFERLTIAGRVEVITEGYKSNPRRHIVLPFK